VKALVVPLVLVAALPFFTAAPTNVRQGSPMECVEVGGVSIWGGVGWNHFVYLTNHCGETVDCSVTTNVNPEPREAIVPQEVTALVVTAWNSPVSVFVPSVTCAFGS
jgi:hypothetical protein